MHLTGCHGESLRQTSCGIRSLPPNLATSRPCGLKVVRAMAEKKSERVVVSTQAAHCLISSQTATTSSRRTRCRSSRPKALRVLKLCENLTCRKSVAFLVSSSPCTSTNTIRHIFTLAMGCTERRLPLFLDRDGDRHGEDLCLPAHELRAVTSLRVSEINHRGAERGHSRPNNQRHLQELCSVDDNPATRKRFRKSVQLESSTQRGWHETKQG